MAEAMRVWPAPTRRRPEKGKRRASRQEQPRRNAKEDPRGSLPIVPCAAAAAYLAAALAAIVLGSAMGAEVASWSI